MKMHFSQRRSVTTV